MSNMNNLSNSVFISYRRSVGGTLALAVWKDLDRNGIDAFYDIESIDADKFDQIILNQNQIAARPYFMPILTPGTLDRCANAGDWVLREIEEAIRLERVIVPLHTPDFSFADMDKYLPSAVAEILHSYSSVQIQYLTLASVMQDVRSRLLKPTSLTIMSNLQTDSLGIQRITIPILSPFDTTGEHLSTSRFSEVLIFRPTDNLENTIAAYTQDIHLDREDVAAYNNRGSARGASGDLDGALADFTEAIRLDPLSAFAYVGRGNVHYTKGDWDNAIADYSEAIRLNPKLAFSYNGRGAARKAKGDLDGAIADYSEAIRLDPTFIFAYSNRGQARSEKGDSDGAIDDYNEALRLDPEDAAVYNDRGVERQNKGDLDGAIADYSEAIRLDPTFALAYGNRGEALDAVDRKDEAIADYRKALELDPDDAEAQKMRDYIAANDN